MAACLGRCQLLFRLVRPIQHTCESETFVELKSVKSSMRVTNVSRGIRISCIGFSIRTHTCWKIDMKKTKSRYVDIRAG